MNNGINDAISGENLLGAKVYYGIPGHQTEQTIKSVSLNQNRSKFNDPYWTINFQSGLFTHVDEKALNCLLEDGEVSYTRASGFTVLEALRFF